MSSNSLFIFFPEICDSPSRIFLQVKSFPNRPSARYFARYFWPSCVALLFLMAGSVGGGGICSSGSGGGGGIHMSGGGGDRGGIDFRQREMLSARNTTLNRPVQSIECWVPHRQMAGNGEIYPACMWLCLHVASPSF
jgi:hypothetical protein